MEGREGAGRESPVHHDAPGASHDASHDAAARVALLEDRYNAPRVAASSPWLCTAEGLVSSPPDIRLEWCANQRSIELPDVPVSAGCTATTPCRRRKQASCSATARSNVPPAQRDLLPIQIAIQHAADKGIVPHWTDSAATHIAAARVCRGTTRAAASSNRYSASVSHANQTVLRLCRSTSRR